MGLCNAPATFQELMNSIFHNVIDEFMVLYLDYLLTYSKSYDEQIKHREIVLSRMKEDQLFVGKSQFELLTIRT